MQIILNERTKIAYERLKGQIYINIPIIYEGSANNDRILFVYDTGAYITVINNALYKQFKLEKLPRKKTALSGYAGSASGYMFQFPGLIIGQRLLTGVWAFTPKSMEIQQNLLGDNIIEYFTIYQDNFNDCLYFLDNPKPQPYIHPESNFSLACDNVLYVGDFHF